MLILNVIIVVFTHKPSYAWSHIGEYLGFAGELYVENSI
jgi:hypothetical protein